MANDTPSRTPAQRAQSQSRKYSNVIELRLNGHLVELPANEDAVRQLMFEGLPEPDIEDDWPEHVEPSGPQAEVKPNGQGTVLLVPVTDDGPDPGWAAALHITGRDITPFMQLGQWRPRTLVKTGNPLNDLMDEYAVALIGGKACVVRWRKDRLPDSSERDVLDMIGKDAFKTFHSDKRRWKEIKQTLQNGDEVTKKIKVPITDDFFLKAQRYDGLVYMPHKGLIVGGAMNLWRGFGVMPQPGSWKRMQEHIYEVLTSGNDEQTIYIVKWCAWAVQNPGRAAEVAAVLRGAEGAGKGVFVQAILRMFGIHGLHLSDREQLVGHFNKPLMYTSLLYGDEAFWAADAKNEGRLKRMITEATLTITPKNVDSFQMPNCLHIIFASNEEWVVPASKDARRFAAVDVSNKVKGNIFYFDKLWEEMNNGGTAAMLHDLLSMDLQGWHPRQDIPQSRELSNQKRLSLKDVDALIHLVATEGRLECLESANKPNAVITTGDGNGTGFISWARRVVRGLQYKSTPKIKDTLIKDWECTRFSRNGKRGLDFPPLKDLRAKFDTRYGPVDWMNPDAEWEAYGGSESASYKELEP